MSADENNEMKVISTNSAEEEVSVNFWSYTKYIFYTKVNYVVFPVCILFFLLTEAAYVLYFRFIAQYDLMKQGSSSTTFKTMSDFWLVLGLLLLGYFIFNILKGFLLYVFVLNSNEAIHKDMIHGVVRSPSWYFDVTPTGRLNNKFSNDLGIMDNMLAFVLTDAIEGPIITIILFVNVFTINLFFLIPGVINIIFIIYYFNYCKWVIVAVKQLDLRLKSPVFNMVG